MGQVSNSDYMISPLQKNTCPFFQKMKSILQDEKKCYFTGYTSALDKHHIFGGGLRNWSEKEGLWVWLRHDLHMKLHQQKPEWERKLKQIAQKKYEESHTREEFMKHVRKNYL